MSAIGAGVGKAVGAIGGPQVATVILLGGLVVGGLAGGVVGSGGPSAGNGSGAQSSNELSIYPCPDSGPAWATVGAGQKFLVTGKTADDAWVRIYWPLPDRDEAWIESGPLKFDGSLAALPIVPCAPIVGGPLAAVAPSPTLTPVEDNSPSPTPSTVASPNSAPTLARLAAGASSIAGGPQRYCNGTARSVVFSVRATDKDAIAGVVLNYREPGSAGFARKPMTKAAGSDTWQATLATDADSISGPGALRYYVSATDAAAVPRSARLPVNGTRSIDVADCTNTGPTLASLKASPSTTHTNPGACRSGATSTTISVNATDVDNVAGVTLRYRLPGDNSYRDQAMSKSGKSWSAKVTPVNQRANADGKASYYVTGKDDLGASSKSSTKTFTVDRCNYPAAIKLSDTTGSLCPGSFFRVFYIASDKDGLSKVQLVYTYVLKDGTTKKTAKQTLGPSADGSYSFDITPDATWSFRKQLMPYYLRTTDKYGGTTKGQTYTQSQC